MDDKIAVIFCSGGSDCADRFIYEGVGTCSAAEMFFGGQKSCRNGCLGYGDCGLKCSKQAIVHTGISLPVVDVQKCDGCGDCIEACPKGLISLLPRRQSVQVRCISTEKSNFIKEVCHKGCISCGVCAKICPLRAIINGSSPAKVNFEKCNLCGLCVEKCPTNTIKRNITYTGRKSFQD